MLWRQRNVQKSVMHVQSCCFANLNPLLFWRCRYPRRRSFVRSLISDNGDRKATLKEWERVFLLTLSFASYKMKGTRNFERYTDAKADFSEKYRYLRMTILISYRTFRCLTHIRVSVRLSVESYITRKDIRDFKNVSIFHSLLYLLRYDGGHKELKKL